MSSYDFIGILNSTLGGAVDFTKTEDKVASVMTVNITFIVLITLTILLRLYVRLFMVRAGGLDDLLMALAAIAAITLSSVYIAGSRFGLGYHIWMLAPDAPTWLNKTRSFTICLYTCYLAYATAICFVKLSICTSYLRIFPVIWLRRCVISIAALVAATWVTSIFIIVFQCNPVNAAWEWSMPNRRCFDVVTYLQVTSAVNIATDLGLFFFPLPLLWKMQMPRPQRIIVCALFGLGAFACVASMLRLSYLYQLRHPDLTYNCISSLNWSVAEITTAIFCASVPSMRPLGTLLLPRLLGSSNSATHSNNLISIPSAAGSGPSGANEWHRLSQSKPRLPRRPSAKEPIVETTRVVSGGPRHNTLRTLRDEDGVACFPAPALDISPKMMRGKHSAEQLLFEAEMRRQQALEERMRRESGGAEGRRGTREKMGF